MADASSIPHAFYAAAVAHGPKFVRMGCPARLLFEERMARLDRCIPLIAESFMMNHASPAFARARREASRGLQRSQNVA